MFRKLSLASLLVVLLVWVSPVFAQGPVLPQHSDPTWQVSYWNNMSLSGAPALQRSEPNINYDWGVNSPAPGTVNADYFSARWTRYIDVTPGTYRFTFTTDDGMRVWVDNELILDQWHVQAPQTYTADKYLGTGHHMIKVEYFEQTGLAVAKLQWQLMDQPTPPPSGGDWRGEYFNNITLSGTPALVRNDSAINFNWEVASPGTGVNSDYFSVRWTRTADMPAAMYNFTLTVDDGARLWVNGHLLIDAWLDQAATTYTGDIYLPGGDATIELQYYERTGYAVAQLSWTTDGQPSPSPVPGGTVIVDDLDTGFVRGGSSTGWHVAYEGHNGHLTWTYNNDQVRANYNWARWYPSLNARNYEVFVFVPYRYTTTGQARYWINHAGGLTLRIVNQSTTGDQWVSLGTYQFNGNSDDYVSLADVTFEPYRSRLIAFDAVKWEPR